MAAIHFSVRYWGILNMLCFHKKIAYLEEMWLQRELKTSSLSLYLHFWIIKSETTPLYSNWFWNFNHLENRTNEYMTKYLKWSAVSNPNTTSSMWRDLNIDTNWSHIHLCWSESFLADDMTCHRAKMIHNWQWLCRNAWTGDVLYATAKTAVCLYWSPLRDQLKCMNRADRNSHCVIDSRSDKNPKMKRSKFTSKT